MLNGNRRFEETVFQNGWEKLKPFQTLGIIYQKNQFLMNHCERNPDKNNKQDFAGEEREV